MKNPKSTVVALSLWFSFVLFSGIAMAVENSNAEESKNASSMTEEEVVSESENTEDSESVSDTGSDPYSFLNRIPGAIEFRGNTYLKLQSAKTLSRYIPCTALEDENATLHTRLIHLKLGLGAIRPQCKEDIAYKFIPYRMTYRASR